MRPVLILAATFLLSSTFAQSTIEGTIAGYNGKPLLAAHAYLLSQRGDTVVKAAADKDGKFSLPYDNKNYVLKLTGVHHRSYYAPIYASGESTQKIHVQLGTFDYDLQPQLKVAGTFNAYSDQKDVIIVNDVRSSKPAEMDFKTNNEVRYFIHGVIPNQTISGIGDGYHPYPTLGGDGYAAASVSKDGKQHFRFDLSQYPPSGHAAKVTYSNPLINRMNGLRQSIAERENKLLQLAMQKGQSGGKVEQFDITGEIRALQKQIDKEKDIYEKQLLLAEYLAIEGSKTKFKGSSRSEPGKTVSMFKGSVEPAYIYQAIAIIPVASPLWVLTKDLLKAPMLALHDTAMLIRQFYNDYIDLSGDDNVKAGTLLALWQRAGELQSPSLEREYFLRLQSEFPESQQSRQAGLRFAGSTKEARKVPAFSEANLDNPTQMISSESLKGKYYILDFWSVGCGGCILKMPTLETIYAQYRSKGLEIVSVAVNPTLQHTRDFRDKRYKLPWLNIQPDNVYNSALMTELGVSALPATFLIDPKGNIVASGDEMSKSSIVQTVEKHLTRYQSN